MTTLYDARLKAVRAEKHLHDLRVELDAWLKRKPQEITFRFSPDDPRDCRVVIRVKEEPPAYLGAIFGDFLNNCRAVLDYIATRLDLHSGGRGERIYFPICKDRAAFERKASKDLAKFDPSHVALIEGVQPFNSTIRPVERHPGMILGRLHRLDKHHAIPAAVVAPETFEIRFTYNDRVESKIVTAEIAGELHGDTEIAHVVVPEDPRIVKVQMEPRIDFALRLGDSRMEDATTPMLAWVRDDVLARFDPVLRKLS